MPVQMVAQFRGRQRPIGVLQYREQLRTQPLTYPQ